MKKVHILLSAYNGERYISAQLNSLLAQDYPNTVIHVRDDGSSDNTPQILRAYAKAGQIQLYEGENLGFIQSFQWLLRNCAGADYYAWCDQDDLWRPNKISLAVAALEKMKTGDTPLLYVSDFEWGDAECHPLRRENAGPLPHTVERRLIKSDLHAFGFTQLFNETCAEKIRDQKACKLMPHDDTVYLLCLCCGQVIWGDQPAAVFRRHGGNASQQEQRRNNAFARLNWQIHHFLFDHSREAYYDRAWEFYDLFREALPEESRRIFELFLRPGHRIRKACWRRRYRDTLPEELGTRALFLMGKL